MHDPAAIWTPEPDWSSAQISREGWQARPVAGLHQTLLSGALDRAAEALAPGPPGIGLWDVAERLPCLVRIARDRGLLVAESPASIADGWHDGWAASDMTDGWRVLEVSGPAAEEIVREGTAADLEASSPSAAVRFAGLVGVLVYRTGAGTVRLHVDRSFAPYLWRWLERRSDRG